MMDGINGKLLMVGDDLVKYDSDNRIAKIGNEKVDRKSTRLNSMIGDDLVRYNEEGKIESIGENRVMYDRSDQILIIGHDTVLYEESP